MTIHTTREERAQLSLACADVAKKSQKDSTDSDASQCRVAQSQG